MKFFFFFQYYYIWKSDNYQMGKQEKKQRHNTKNKAKKFKSDIFTMSNRKSPILLN